MSTGGPTRNNTELDAIQAVADSGEDRPVLMLNLNRYSPDAEFPNGDNYQKYMTVLADLLPRVGARILWRVPVQGQPVGEQPIDEILAAWYPSHRAFIDLPNTEGAKENFRLRRLCVEYAVIHRCPGDRAPLCP